MEENNLYERILKEEWKDIPGFEGDYKLNCNGEMLAINKGSIYLHPLRYCLSLCKNGVKSKASTIALVKELFGFENAPFKIQDQLFGDIEGEVWKSVEGWEEWYSISNKGRLFII